MERKISISAMRKIMATTAKLSSSPTANGLAYIETAAPYQLKIKPHRMAQEMFNAL